jgi:hypothetical protein
MIANPEGNTGHGCTEPLYYFCIYVSQLLRTGGEVLPHGKGPYVSLTSRGTSRLSRENLLH